MTRIRPVTLGLPLYFCCMNLNNMLETRIFLLLQPEANLLDLGAIGQAFQEAREMGILVNTILCSESDSVTCSIGTTLSGLLPLRHLTPAKGDYVFVISSHMKYVLSSRNSPSESLLEFVRHAYEAGSYVCGICNGAFLLGKAGLLNHRQCTTHWKRTSELKEHFPLAKVSEDVLFVEDGRILTSAGSASALDVALHVISKIRDDYFSHKIARELVVFKRRTGLSPQHSLHLRFRNHYHRGIHCVQDFLELNIHQPVSIHQLAEMANMSERNFSRIFRREVQLTVFEYINRLRRQVASELIKNPDFSKRQIANQVGLTSERQISRILKKESI